MRHASMLWGNVKRELGKFLTKVFVGGSLTGTGTEADPIELDGDEESPEPNYYYGTDEDGEKGYHELISLKGEDGKDGEDGTSVYTYVAYAGDNAGTGFSLTPTNLLKYRAEIHVAEELTPPVAADFTGAVWVKYIGDDGGGGPGGAEPPELFLDFEEEGDEFVYNVPYKMKFVSQNNESTNPVLSIPLNTVMDEFDKLTVTATAPGLVRLYGEYVE